MIKSPLKFKTFLFAFPLAAIFSPVLFKYFTSRPLEATEKKKIDPEMTRKEARTNPITVSIQQTVKGTDFSHHGKNRFVNPWPSFRETGFKDVLKMVNFI